MIGLLQRVRRASVEVEDEEVAAIGRGILVLVGVERRDGEKQASRLAERLVNYRVFADDEGRMNLSVSDTDGGILLVPQFTLAANTRKGTRASFARAADPHEGERLYERLLSEVGARHPKVASGVFGANMQVALVNDGPVTFWLDTGGPAE
ncbi:MAG: D-tyrosyl-tRNA(Tyr) deacylase [Gammaproteobacteria bacterium]|nr:D-tyrosyl-tRNA(Tyr) deacylase [Gammaproteobacteria bacterium]